MSYYGDIRLGDTIDIKFTTVISTGAVTSLAGSPVISAYPGNSTTELTAGITLTVDIDGRTGLNNVRVVATSGNGYATATNYALVITAGTVGGSGVVSYVVGSFSIENRSALMPTTAARTALVAADGSISPNWADVKSPTTTVGLSGTTIATSQAVASVSGAVGSVTGAVGSVTAKVTPIDVDGITFASAMELLMAVLAGVAAPSGSTVLFKKRDGTTTKITITYGATDGERTGSTINS